MLLGPPLSRGAEVAPHRVDAPIAVKPASSSPKSRPDQRLDRNSSILFPGLDLKHFLSTILGVAPLGRAGPPQPPGEVA